MGIDLHGSNPVQWCTTVKKLIKLKEILAKVPVSRAHIYNMIGAGKFPRQVKLGGFGAFWVEEEIDTWIQGHIDAADRDSNPHTAIESEAA
jgi:predicted DNA-binding transcriptional regulator AlpA